MHRQVGADQHDNQYGEDQDDWNEKQRLQYKDMAGAPWNCSFKLQYQVTMDRDPLHEATTSDTAALLPETAQAAELSGAGGGAAAASAAAARVPTEAARELAGHESDGDRDGLAWTLDEIKDAFNRRTITKAVRH
jgi:hypothetical protein